MTDRNGNAPGGDRGRKSEQNGDRKMLDGSMPQNGAAGKGRVCAALEYAGRGMEVFPAPPGEKKSHKSEQHSGTKWGKTTDADEIRRDWDKWPSANVGIATGAASGVWAIDLDVRGGGLEAWAALVAQHPPLPPTVTVETPTGGRHYWWRWPGVEVRNSAGAVGPGIDVRGEGGMVIAPPSVKPGIGAYAFAPGLAPWEVAVAEAPGWLVALVKKKPAARPTVTADAEEGLLQRLAQRHMAEVRAEAEAAKLAEAAPGTRNDTLSRVAYTLGGLAHYLADDAARDMLLGAVADWDDPEKCRSTIDRQMAAGAAKPLTLTAELDDLLLSHEDMARALIEDGWAANNRWCPNWGEWLEWAGHHWRRRKCRDDAVKELRAFLSRAAREVATVAEADAERIRRAAVNAPNAPRSTRRVHARGKQMADRLGAVAYDAALETKMRSEVGAAAADFDADPLLLGTPGGVVDLRTGRLRPGRRGDMISRVTGVEVAPEGARSEEWEKFLEAVFPGDAEMWEFLQRLAGYCLTGLTREERFFFFHGTGRNGKGTFLETLMTVMGDYATVAPSGLFLSNSNLNLENFLAGLDGARMIWGSEIDRGRMWNEALLKEISGGEPMTAMKKYRDSYTFHPQATLIIAGNTQPSFRGVSDTAMRSRVALVMFEQTFAGKEDRGLKARLKGPEAPAILRWAVDGARMYLKSGLPLPKSVQDASKEYMDDNDVLLCFVEDECERDEKAWTPTALLFERYRNWAHAQGIKAFGQRTITKMLKEQGWSVTKPDSKWGVKGLKLVQKTETTEPSV